MAELSQNQPNTIAQFTNGSQGINYCGISGALVSGMQLISLSHSWFLHYATQVESLCSWLLHDLPHHWPPSVFNVPWLFRFPDPIFNGNPVAVCPKPTKSRLLIQSTSSRYISSYHYLHYQFNPLMLTVTFRQAKFFQHLLKWLGYYVKKNASFNVSAGSKVGRSDSKHYLLTPDCEESLTR